MSANTALITDAAKVAARQTLADYSAGVFAHTTGDWGKHNVVRVYDQVFQDQAGHNSTVATLRILATLGTTDLAIALPVNPTGQDVQLTSAPIITVQPSNVSVGTGGTARFVVGAISDTALTYQWYKDGAALSGQTAGQLVIPQATSANAGSYYVVVTNVNGSTQSAIASLVVASGSIDFEEDGSGFDFIGFVTFPFSSFF